MLGETHNQFSLTRAALSYVRRARANCYQLLERMKGHEWRLPVLSTAIRVGLFTVTLAGSQAESQAGTFLDAWQDTLPRGQELSAITYADGRFVAAGPGGELLTSSNAVSWQHGTIPAVGGLADITYGNGLFLAVGSVSNKPGLVMVSSNAVDWTTNIVSTDRVDSSAFGNGRFVAACYRSLLNSVDGVHWSPSSSPPLFAWGVDFVGDHFLAVGPGGQRATSPDGLTWSILASGDGPDLWASAQGNGTTVMVGDRHRILTISGTNSIDSWGSEEDRLSDVAYGNGRFVAVGWLSDFWLSVIWTSTDGLVWERSCVAEFYLLDHVAFGEGVFTAVGGAGTVLTSPDGVNWTVRRGGVPAQTFSAAAANGTVVTVGGGFNAVGTVLALQPDGSWRCPAWDFNIMPHRITYENGQYMVVGSAGSVSTSPDGLTWTHHVSANTNYLQDITYGQGQYVIVSSGGQVERSADGMNWTNQNLAPGTELLGVAYGANRFVTVGSGGAAFSSADAITWASANTGTSNWLYAVAFGEGAFIAVGWGGSILRSTDGQSWESQPSPTSNWLTGVRFLANRFIALGQYGTILTSPNGTTWQQHVSGVSDTLYDAALFQNRLLVVGDYGTALLSEQEVYPTLQPLGWRPGVGFEFAMPTDLGRPWCLQVSTNLATWQAVDELLPTSGTNCTYLDWSATNHPIRFYRVKAD